MGKIAVCRLSKPASLRLLPCLIKNGNNFSEIVGRSTVGGRTSYGGGFLRGLAVGAVGAIVDWRYIRRGRMKPTRNDNIGLFISIGVVGQFEEFTS